MLTATYRLRIGSRLRQLALLTAIGAVMSTCDRMGVPIASWHRDSFDHLGSGGRALVELHHAAVHSHHLEGGAADGIEP